MSNVDDGLRAVVITPGGRGAVAVVVVEGVDAARVADGCFRPAVGGSLAQRAVGRIVFGRWGHASAAGEEVVACRKSELQVEVQCHGGSAAMRRILDDLVACGVRLIDWQQWRIEGADDVIAAEADIALAQATTQRAASVLLEQRAGALRREVDHAIAVVENEKFESGAARVRELLARGRIGLRLAEPWRIVLAGPPNVGKSSLINALLGYERAIVFDQPGTTRDVVTAMTAFDGWACELSDTAGLRVSDDALEQAGVERARAQIARADIVLLVDDREPRARSQEEVVRADWFADGRRTVIRVWNKCDLCEHDTVEELGGAIRTSAKTRFGIAGLGREIVARLVGEPPATGAGIPFTERQVGHLRSAEACLAGREFSKAAGHLTQIVRPRAS